MKIIASERKVQGTSASRRLRRSGKVPGIIYGHGEALPIELDHNDLWHTMRVEAAHSSILSLEIDGKETKVITRDVQYHAYKPFITHIDFQRVNMKEVIIMKVPVHYSGAEESPAVKIDGQMINYVLGELEVECLPGNLPESIAVDLSKLEKDGTIRASDLTFPEGVVIVGNADEQTLASAVDAATENEASGETSAEGEAPAA